MNLRTKFGKARLYLKLKKFFSMSSLHKRVELDELQSSVVTLAKIVLSKKETDLLLSPVEGLLYANWEHVVIKISEKSDEIVVMNGKYYYYFYLPTDEVNNLRKRFYRSLSHRQSIWESRFNEHALSNIKAILQEVEDTK